MSLHFIIDGYNLIKKIPLISAKKINQAREDLIRLIQEKRLTGSKRNKVTIVFDGDAENLVLKEQLTFRIIFSKDADKKIEDLVKKEDNPKESVVITDDRQLQYSVRILGAKVKDVESFLERLKKPKIIIEDSKLELSSQIKDEITRQLKKLWLREDERE